MRKSPVKQTVFFHQGARIKYHSLGGPRNTNFSQAWSLEVCTSGLSADWHLLKPVGGHLPGHMLSSSMRLCSQINYFYQNARPIEPVCILNDPILLVTFGKTLSSKIIPCWGSQDKDDIAAYKWGGGGIQHKNQNKKKNECRLEKESQVW